MTIREDQLVDDVMRRHPATIAVFLHWRMHCVGCPVGQIHTVSDACLEHDADLDLFLADLRRAAAAAPAAGETVVPP